MLKSQQNQQPFEAKNLGAALLASAHNLSQCSHSPRSIKLYDIVEKSSLKYCLNVFFLETLKNVYCWHAILSELVLHT